MQLILKSILLTTATFLTVPAIAGGYEMRVPLKGVAVKPAETPPQYSPSTALFVDFNERIVDTTGRSTLAPQGISFRNTPGTEGTAAVFSTGVLAATNPEFLLQDKDFSLEWWQKDQTSVTALTLGQPYGYASILSHGNQIHFSENAVAWTHVIPLAPLNPNKWTHIAIIRDAGTLTVAVDGQFQGSSSINPGTILLAGASGTTLHFGQTIFTTSGLIDQLKFSIGASVYKYGVPFTPSTTLTP